MRRKRCHLQSRTLSAESQSCWISRPIRSRLRFAPERHAFAGRTTCARKGASEPPTALLAGWVERDEMQKPNRSSYAASEFLDWSETDSLAITPKFQRRGV